MERLRPIDCDQRWAIALAWAAPISLFLLALFYYWFGVADRYAIFLYGHTNVGIPAAQPFDELTRGRYWMAGLVAAGAVLLIYTVINWVLGRFAASRRRVYLAPPWRRVWLLCALPLSVGIPAVTMTVNTPTLPLELAIACVAATLAGLALALWPGAWAAQRPRDLFWLAGDGMGLMPVLLVLRAVELPGRGISVSVSLAWVFALGGILVGLAWLGLMTGLRAWRRTRIPSACELMAAGLSLSYVLLPLVHHWLATPPAYRYISAASNFFAFDMGIQIVALLVAAVLAVTATWVRRRLRVTTVAGQIC